jgi:hypothetical protein
MRREVQLVSVMVIDLHALVIVDDVCVKNPCSNAECDSPACIKTDKDECIYDECSQYTLSGLFHFILNL